MPYVINEKPIQEFIQPAVHFVESEHRYYNAKGEEYQGVSSVLKKLSVPFQEKEAYKRANPETRQKWKLLGEEASGNGKLFHKCIEDDWDDKPIPLEMAHLTEHIKAANRKYKSYDAVYNEVVMYDHDYKLCGTADRVMLMKNKAGIYTAEIMDFKTNAKEKNGNLVGLTFFSDYHDKLFAPLDHLDDCDYTKYTLQLSFYAYMFEKLTGIKVRRIFIDWIPYKDPAKGRVFPCIYMKNEVRGILERLKNNRETVVENLFDAK